MGGRKVDEHKHEAELELLDLPYTDSNTNDIGEHQLLNAPVFEREAYLAADLNSRSTQYGVLAGIRSINCGSQVYYPSDPILYLNTNAPFSSVICGVQGSGKSHTVAVMLENMFVSQCPQIGSLQRPLSGLVLHYGEGGKDARPCEAAMVAIPTRPGLQTPYVRIYVTASSLEHMRSLYLPLGNRVSVEPLYFEDRELDAQAFLTLMGVGSDSEQTPLYVEIILSILRELGQNFSYRLFYQKLIERKRMFNEMQQGGLAQRLSLVESFLARKPVGGSRYAAGQITLVDLSDPFIDPATACGIFDILVRQFQRQQVDTGKVLVVDEAHKYLGSSRAQVTLSKTLIDITRQQRHLGMRVILSTQEPTVVPPAFLGLCSILVLHRFSSPSWYEHIVRHLAARLQYNHTFNQLVHLQTGQAMVVAPSGLKIKPLLNLGTDDPVPRVEQFGRSYMLVMTRRRVTKDGGASVLAVRTA
ncbi:hypothetical protein AX16_000243 [Volvariella volvacea WC 439]|nr:hypothetical protein AX16_000243 [Volvariella volvacea WC 439]